MKVKLLLTMSLVIFLAGCNSTAHIRDKDGNLRLSMYSAKTSNFEFANGATLYDHYDKKGNIVKSEVETAVKEPSGIGLSKAVIAGPGTAATLMGMSRSRGGGGNTRISNNNSPVNNSVSGAEGGTAISDSMAQSFSETFSNSSSFSGSNSESISNMGEW